MIGFTESMYYYSLQGCLRVKAEIISPAGQTDVLLPSLIARGCPPRTESRARLSVLQAVEPHALVPAGAQFDLGAECSAAEINLVMKIPPEYGSQSP
jgi:hypothetical protein